jgi:hypothetical protein
LDECVDDVIAYVDSVFICVDDVIACVGCCIDDGNTCPDSGNTCPDDGNTCPDSGNLNRMNECMNAILISFHSPYTLNMLIPLSIRCSHTTE